MSSPDTVIQPQAYQPPSPGGRPPRRPVSRRAWIYAAVGAGLLLFGLAMGFLFTARAVTVSVTPAPEHLEVSGGLVLRWGERYLMPAGEYRVQAQKARYHDLDARFTVGPEPSQTHTFEMALLPGRLVVHSTPEAAEVAIDGTAKATLPVAFIALEQGTYELRVSAARHEDHTQTIEITGGGDELRANVARTPAWAPVSLSSTPPGATIEVDGKAEAKTPATVDMGAGERQVTLSAPGFKPWTRTLTVVADVPQTVPPVTLEPADGQVAVTSEPSGAAVRVGGTFRGNTPLTLSLTANQAHTVKVSLEGHSAAEQRVTLAPEGRESLRFELTPVLGAVRFEITPADAEVLIDGKPVQVSGRTLRLPARSHQLQVRKAGHVSQGSTFTPQPDSEQRVTVKLLTEAEARLASMPPTVSAANGHTLKRIPPGSFTLGTPRNDQGRQANEGQRPITLTRHFYLSTTEVTNAQFRAFLGSHVSGVTGRQTLDNEQQPVVRVSWLQAVRYCNWLSAQQGLTPAYTHEGELITPVGTGYRLPSEAEWAWAARHALQPTPLRYPWGAAMPPPPGSGNFADERAKALVNDWMAGYDDGYAASAPVGRYAVSRVGLFDMGGNVSEWMHDRYDGALVISPQPQVDPFGAAQGGDRVVRGSSYRHGRITELRLAWRDFARAERDDLGFRVARYAE